MVTHKSVKQWQRFSLSRRQEYFKKFFQTILQETFTGSRHFASPVSWLMLASSSSSSLCTVCLWAVSSSCINWIARGKDWWDLWKQEPSICKSSKSAFSQPRYNLVQPFAAFYFKIFVQLKSSVQNLFQIAHHLKTWILTDTNSFGCWKQDIFFFLPLSLIPWSNIAANVCIKNLSTCTYFKRFTPSAKHYGRFGNKMEPVNFYLLLPVWGGDVGTRRREVRWKRRLTSWPENDSRKRIPIWLCVTFDTRGFQADAAWPGIGGKQATMNPPSFDLRNAWGCGRPQPLSQTTQKMPHRQRGGKNCAPLAFSS